MIIYAPVKNTNGIYASLVFKDGKAETDDPRLIRWFKEHGYKVAYPNPEEVETPEILVDEEIDFRGMSPLQLRAYLIDHGYKVGSVRTKDKLLEILKTQGNVEV